MKTISKRGFTEYLLLFLLSLTIAITGACGGGSGGGGGSSGGSDITYTGSTSQATVNSANGEDIATSAYRGGSSGTIFGAVQSGSGSSIEQPRTIIIAQSLVNAVNKIEISSGVVAGAIQTDSGTNNGPCGGSLSYTINYDDQTGSFNGTFNFNGYCDNGTTLSGGVSVSGQINLSTGRITQLNMSFNPLTFISGNDSFTISGSFNMSISTSTVAVTMNILMRDNTTGKVYWVQNYTLTITATTSYVDIQISGRFYHPDYGYVVLSITTPFRVYSGNMWPSQGVLIATGSGNSRARLTAISSTQYRVEIDANGDGTYEYNSGPKDWSSL